MLEGRTVLRQPRNLRLSLASNLWQQRSFRWSSYNVLPMKETTLNSLERVNVFRKPNGTFWNINSLPTYVQPNHPLLCAGVQTIE